MREQSHSFILDRAEFVSSAPLGQLVEQPCDSLPNFADRPTARDGPATEQKLLWASLMIAAAMALILWPSATLSYVRTGLWVLFLVVSLIRGMAVFLSKPPPQTILSRRKCGGLPIYSVIVPLYKEANMVKQMVRNLKALNYPQKALDVIFAIEADDSQTLNALKKQRLPCWMRIIIAPPGSPQTKPRACNVALDQAVGSLIVIYDAEDRPHPDQLIEAAYRFMAADRQLACLQAPLRILPGKGFWSRQFALEYAAHFETFLPALAKVGSAVPLGGTSNHLRVEALRQLGGWDPYNVTEDADLGFRLAGAGFRTEMLTLPTWETPTTQFSVWLPQRSRWLKGYMQTLIVWTRAPSRLTLANQASLWLTLGVSVLSALIHGPIALMVLIQSILAVCGWAPFISSTGLVLIATAWTAAALSMSVGAKRAGIDLQAKDLALAVAYWPLATLAAGRAFYQLLFKPYYWDKTPHKPEPLRTAP
jgi:cellulose synthase/poly-beta-1,6-N-acetylglucosamine synthase-like glycosyltransferase